MQNLVCKFDLGKAFINLFRYLTIGDKLNLASTCSLLREVTLRIICRQFYISDNKISIWEDYLCWVTRYMPIIQPYALHINITQENSEDKTLFALLLQGHPYIHELTIRTNSVNLHLAIANGCPNTKKIVFQSNQINDGLVEYMFKFLPSINHIEVNSDALEFTCSNICKYLHIPIKKLILKPYQLNYDSILELVSNQQLNQLDQLQIDVEECPSDTLISIISHLKNIRQLRLFHMENFEDVDTLSNRLSQQITELTLSKCYKLQMTTVISKIASNRLECLDLTEASQLRDEDILELAIKSNNLRVLNISWCNFISNDSVRQIINSCPLIERLILTGLKSLTDQAFEEYLPFKSSFNEKQYDETRYQIKKSRRDNRQLTMAQLQNQFNSKMTNISLFTTNIYSTNKRITLFNLQLLDCNSCNSISDCLLKVIYCLNRTSHVVNYYGEDLSLFSSLSSDDFD